MAQGKLRLQANDGKVVGIVFEDGAVADVTVTVPKEGGEFLTTEGAQTKNGVITFADSPIVPVPENYNECATKGYVDSRSSESSGVRQTVQYASTDQTTGLPNFITAGTGLTVNISATTKNIKISAAGGDTDRIGKITADTTITGLSANAINYLYADIALDGTVTLGSTTIAPEYQQGLPSTDFPTWDTVNKGSGVTLSNGNLTATKVVTSSWANSNVYASKLVKDGKFYAEVTVGAFASAGYLHIGVSTINTKQNDTFPYATTGYSYLDSGTKTTNSVATAYGASYTAGDVIGVLFDYATGQLSFYKNGVSQGIAYTLTANTPVYLAVSQYSTGNVTVNYGASAFAYPLPSGAVAWNAERIVGKHIFDTSLMEMWLSNGTSYDKKLRVFLGEAIANQGTNLRLLGTNIGTLTGGGGLASAFDGITSQAYTASANIVSTGQLSGTIGKDWGVGVTKKIGSLKLYGTQDGFTSNTSENFTFKLQGSQDSSTWTDLYTSGVITDAPNLLVSVDSGIDTSTAYRYHRLQLNETTSSGTAHLLGISELELYEYGTEAVTSVVNYALNGVYDSGWILSVPTVGSNTIKNHNIGTENVVGDMNIKCITADAGYSVGDMVTPDQYLGYTNSPLSLKLTNKTVRLKVAVNNLQTINASTGASAAINPASWAYKFKVRRSF